MECIYSAIQGTTVFPVDFYRVAWSRSLKSNTLAGAVSEALDPRPQASAGSLPALSALGCSGCYRKESDCSPAFFLNRFVAPFKGTAPPDKGPHHPGSAWLLYLLSPRLDSIALRKIASGRCLLPSGCCCVPGFFLLSTEMLYASSWKAMACVPLN